MSNLLSYAENELNRIGMTEDSPDEMNRMMRKHILHMMQEFANEGHSGFSASYAISILTKLMDFKPLSPLTGDEWNANNWSLHWLIFRIWTLEHFSFGADINIQSDSLSVGFIVPYLRVIIGFHHMWQWTWLMKLGNALRRRPALKNHNGEYN